MASNHCSIFVAPSSPVKGVRLQELNCLNVKVEGGWGSTLESTEDSGLGTAWIFDIISGMTLASSLAIDLAMIETIFLLELEPLMEPESRLADLYKVD